MSVKLTGSCYCRNLEYVVELHSENDARTSLCHCNNCKVRRMIAFSVNAYDLTDTVTQKAFGGNYGLTAKVPKDSFEYTKGKPKEHVADNGSGMILHREFCDLCGSFILEYGVRHGCSSPHYTHDFPSSSDAVPLLEPSHFP